MPTSFQRSFAGGIITQPNLNRKDTAKVASGLADILNGWVLPGGAFQSRPGFRWITTTKDQADHVRIRRFFFNDAQAYALEFGEFYIRLYQLAEPLAYDSGLEISGNFYLGHAPDDVALSGLAGTPSRAFALRKFAGQRTPQVVPGGAGLATFRITYTSLTGVVGGVGSEYWPTGTVSLNLKFLDYPCATPPGYGGSANQGVVLSANLYRVNSSGAKVDGPHGNDGGFISLLASGALTTSLSLPDLRTVTWTNVAWGGVFAANDRLVVELVFDTGAFTNPTACVYEIGTENALLTSSIGQPVITLAPGWDDGATYQVGDIVAVKPWTNQPLALTSSDSAPSPSPTGYAGAAADEPFASLTAGTPSAGDLFESMNQGGALEKQVLVTAATVPGWTAFPDTGMTVDINFGDFTGAQAMNYDLLLSRLDSSNVLQVETATSVQYTGRFVNAGDGPFRVYVEPPTAGWGTVLATDRFGMRVRYASGFSGTSTLNLKLGSGTAVSLPGVENMGAATLYYRATAGSTGADPRTSSGSWSLASTPTTTASAWDVAGLYVPGDVVFTGTIGDINYYYCVATHIGKNPDTVIYQNDFWYPLPVNASGDPILEIPTPYTAEDVPDVVASPKQSGDTITITHHNYPPHELVRHLDEVYSFGRWSFLPIGFKPRMTAPTGIAFTDSGFAGSKTIRYKVTAIDRDTGAESSAGQYTATATGAVTGDPTVALDNPTDATNSLTQDILVTDAAHGLVDGAEIAISLVTTTSADRANENAVIALEGTTWTIAKVDNDSFRLNGSAGLLTRPVISSVVEGYPTFNITYALDYAELINVKVPRSSGGSRVALEWAEVPNAKQYFVYRTILGLEGWGFLNATPELTWADEGDQETASGETSVPAFVDSDVAPPDYRSPFRYGTWPRANAYHMQRQWFGGTVNEPLRAWGSVVGDFRNFSTRTPIVASDSLDFTINSEDANEIQSMAAMGVLLIFTTGVVWKLPGNLDGVIAADEPPNLQTVTYEGASGVGPLVVGDSAIFLRAPGRSAIKALRIDAGERGATAQPALDLTLYAPELFKGYTIADLARMSIPNNLVFAVRSDGQMLCLTYVLEQEVWAWARMETRVATDAFQSVCAIPEEGADALYAIIRRSINGTDTWFVERMDQRRLGEADVDDRVAMYFVDAGLTFDGTNDTAITLTLSPPGSPTWLAGATGYTLTASAALFVAGDVDNGYRLVAADGTTEAEVIVTAFTSATVVTVKLLTAVAVSLRSTARATWVKMVDDVSGLSHLNGETVAIFADGYRLGTAAVTAGAIPKLVKFAGLLTGANFPSNRPYGIIHVGLPIDVSFEVTPIDTGDESAISSALKRVGQAALWLNRSYRPSAGPVDGALFALPSQHGDVETTLITGPRVATIEGTFNREGRVKVQQTGPVPLEVTALMLEYEVGGF